MTSVNFGSNLGSGGRIADFVLYPLSFLEASFCESFASPNPRPCIASRCGRKFVSRLEGSKKAPRAIGRGAFFLAQLAALELYLAW